MRPRVKVKAGGRVPWGEEGNPSVAAHMWCVWAWGVAGIEGKMLGSQDSILKVGKGRIVRVAGRGAGLVRLVICQDRPPQQPATAHVRVGVGGVWEEEE